MKLCHPEIDHVFDLTAPIVNSLVVESPQFLRELLQDFSSQIDGFSGKAVLSLNDTPVDFRRNAEMIDSFITFELGKKTLLNKLISRLESIAVDENNYNRTAQLLGELELYVQDLCFDFPCDVFCSKVSIGNILKAIGLDLSDDYDDDLERYLDYMELTRDLDRDKLFIYVNLRSFYSDEELASFLSSVIDHDMKVLLIDSSPHSVLSQERRLTIDSDLCEF